MKTKIIFEDEDILIVHKPSGIATQTDRMGQIDVVSELKNYLAKKGKNTYIGVIHRLDQPVEGLLVFAKINICYPVSLPQTLNIFHNSSSFSAAACYFNCPSATLHAIS